MPPKSCLPSFTPFSPPTPSLIQGLLASVPVTPLKSPWPRSLVTSSPLTLSSDLWWWHLPQSAISSPRIACFPGRLCHTLLGPPPSLPIPHSQYQHRCPPLGRGANTYHALTLWQVLCVNESQLALKQHGFVCTGPLMHRFFSINIKLALHIPRFHKHRFDQLPLGIWKCKGRL